MTLIPESRVAVNELASWLSWPSRLFAIAAACGFLLFAPKKFVDMVVRPSNNLPEVLNPWVGLVFLFTLSFLGTHYITKFLWFITKLFRRKRPSDTSWESL
jgi:hypothetical protein